MKTAPWDAVIFDYGRVLSPGPNFDDLRHLTAITGVPDPTAFFDFYAGTRAAYDCGLQDYQQHWATFSNAAGITLTSEQVECLAELETRMWLRTDPAVLALARESKSNGFQTAILSNMPWDLLGVLRRELDWLAEFEVQIWSCELGIVKPKPEIYRACLDSLRCQPSRALFFDDRNSNVEAARGLGIDAHVFTSAAQAKAIFDGGMSA